MFRQKANIFFIAILFNFFTFQVSSLEPNIFVQSTVNRASQILSDDISKNQKIEKLKLVAKETVDIKGIGFYSLGNTRKRLNNSQIENYSNLFELRPL